MIMGHMRDMACLLGQKKKYHQVTWVIGLFCLGKKPISPHSEHSDLAFDSAYNKYQIGKLVRKKNV